MRLRFAQNDAGVWGLDVGNPNDEKWVNANPHAVAAAWEWVREKAAADNLTPLKENNGWRCGHVLMVDVVSDAEAENAR